MRVGLLVAGLLIAGSVGRLTAQPALAGYADAAAFRAEVDRLDASELVQVRSLGVTLGGREILVLTVGVGDVDRKPALAVVGSVQPSHLLGAELSLRMARRLVEQAGADPAVRALLDRFTFYFVPRPAPDGGEALFRRPWQEHDGNARWTDDDRDGESGEDPGEDLDGDGALTWMRVSDPQGKFLAHPGDGRVLIEANPREDERGVYALFPEGTDNDGDGAWNEDGSSGVEFNRNFPFQYPHFRRGAGPNAVSEPETRALADFLYDRRNIAIVFSFSPEDNLMHPWQPNAQIEGERIKRVLLGADAPYVQFMARAYQEIRAGADAPAPPDGEGSFTEWAYFHYGRWSFAARGWWIPKVPPPPGDGEKKNGSAEPAQPRVGRLPKPDDARGQELINALRWFEREGIPGFTPWTAIPHPDFPGRTVEIGGIRPFFRWNPPAREFDDLTTRHFAFLRRLAEWMPELRVSDTRVERLGDGMFRLTVVVANHGYLPTMAAMGKVSGAVDPLWFELTLPKGAELRSGAVRGRLEPLDGGGGKVELTWLFRYPPDVRGPAALDVGSPAAGRVQTSIGVE